MDEHRYETREVRTDARSGHHGAVNTPIYANTTYEYDSPTSSGEYRYERMGAPTRDALEATLADAHGGTDAFAFASGMAAIDAVLSLLSPGDRVVAGADLYAETHELLATEYPGYGIEVDQVDATDADAVAAAVDDETAMVYVESPTNPMLRVVDLAAVAAAADEHDAVLAVDNTFASPYLQRPLQLGADLVAESLTKYVGGHSDAVAGAVVTDDAALAEQVHRTQYVRGAILGPFESFLVSRGAKTLSARMDRHCGNARRVAEWLDDHPAVERVHYPGLESHPGHEVAAEQMADFGGMVSVELAGGVDAAAAFVAALEVFTLAESLGSVESLVEHPASMTHQDLDDDALAGADISPGLVRFSVGTEHPDDLLADLDRAAEVALS